jgi:hypothetical protein
VHEFSLYRVRLIEQSTQQDFVHASAKPLFAVDLDDWHALVVLPAERIIGIDIDQSRHDSMPAKNRECVITEVATLAGVKGHVGHESHSDGSRLGHLAFPFVVQIASTGSNYACFVGGPVKNKQ